MTYSRNAIAGLSFAEAVNALCSAVTSAERWARFHGCIEVSERWTVSIGGDYIEGRCRSLYGLPPTKTQAEIEAEAYAAALRPMVDDLAAGGLVITGAPVGDDTKAAEAIQASAWRGKWKLILEGQDAILRRPSSTEGQSIEFVLEGIQACATEPPRAAADTVAALAIQTEADPQVHKSKAKRRGVLATYEREALHKALISECLPDCDFPLKRKEQKQIEDWARGWLRKNDQVVKSSGEDQSVPTIRRYVKKAIKAYLQTAAKPHQKALPVGS